MKNYRHMRFVFIGLILTGNLVFSVILPAQTAMINVAARKCISLNGQWQVIIDPIDIGNWRKVWEEKKPEKKTDFYEYSFEGGPVLNVPGDFNTQLPELKYYEGTIWYRKVFQCPVNANKRYFLHFGAVNYIAEVYLNGKLIGSHEGGFTPFQFEITGQVWEGNNTVIVMVNNHRLKDGIPGLGYDWFNYGGITRDVDLIETSASFIEDYFIQLKKHSFTEVSGWIKINGNRLAQQVNVQIAELGVNVNTTTDSSGIAKIDFTAPFRLWSPQDPKLYNTVITSGKDTVTDDIGFRTIEAEGANILLNGKTIFLKGVNIHEEMPIRAAKAFSEADTKILLTWAKELGCNAVRLAHYPHNEYMVKLAEKIGLMVWDEIPVYQHIGFSAPGVTEKIDLMLREMIRRDRNRCAVIIWCLSNETWHFTSGRDSVLIKLSDDCRSIDSTRLITTVLCTQEYKDNTMNVWDPLYCHFDIISVNEYLGWYVPWQGRPSDTKWEFVCEGKPVIISEFGGEALYGNHDGPADEAAWWNEEYQEQIYRNQVELFATVPNLCGTFPWILADFRSLSRMNQVYQNGWNRKGLLSDRGERKKAWFVLKKYYDSLEGE